MNYNTNSVLSSMSQTWVDDDINSIRKWNSAAVSINSLALKNSPSNRTIEEDAFTSRTAKLFN